MEHLLAVGCFVEALPRPVRSRRRERDVLPHRRLRVIERMPPLFLAGLVPASERLRKACDLHAGGTGLFQRLGETCGLEGRELDVRCDAPPDLSIAVSVRPIESE